MSPSRWADVADAADGDGIMARTAGRVNARPDSLSHPVPVLRR